MKTIREINERIKKGKAVVLTAKEVKELSKQKSIDEIAEEVDVVTTATFSPMCSTGVFLNFGHTIPAMKFQKVLLDNVPAFGGLAAADIFLGATEQSITDEKFGGAHVIHKLIKGEKIHLKAEGIPTDCYPRKSFEADFDINDINQAYFFNPRNNYQNYNAAVNSSDKPLYTYMGHIKPKLKSINYVTTGEISPLINDPDLETIGIGTRIFFGGGEGYIAWEGTQFNSEQVKNKKTNLPIGPGATLAIIADLRNVKPEFIKPVFIPGYGVSIYISIGIAIPVLNKNIAKKLLIRNKDIITNVVDYSNNNVVTMVNYEELIDNKFVFNNKRIPSKTYTNIKKSKEILNLFKEKILNKKFYLTEPVKGLPIFGRFKNFGGK